MLLIQNSYLLYKYLDTIIIYYLFVQNVGVFYSLDMNFYPSLAYII